VRSAVSASIGDVVPHLNRGLRMLDVPARRRTGPTVFWESLHICEPVRKMKRSSTIPIDDGCVSRMGR
jgi:hypothetical protein